MGRITHRIIWAISFLMAVSLFGAAPTITGFTPSSGTAGTSVVISGTNLSGATAVKFNGVAASSFSGTTTITAVAPTGVTTGKISVTTSGGTATSSGSFTVVAAPAISSFTPTSGVAGTSVVISGTNLTGATAVKFNGVAASSFSGTTTITAVAPSGVTTGKISVTTPGGTANSSTSFTAITPPSITTQPSSQTVTLGSTATFSVVAGGTAPLAYQWSKNGSAISGAIASSYTTPATVGTDSGSTFSVKVSNSGGTATSNTVTLAVNLPPTITTQPTNQSVLMGATATFSVAASGTGTLTYQWFKNGGSISGATSISYTTPTTVLGDSGALFTVKVTNTYGNVTSPAANLTVTAPVPPTITTQPSGQTVTLGSAATFSVVAAGTAPLSYQWFKNGTSVSGWYLPHRFKQPPVRLRPSPRQ